VGLKFSTFAFRPEANSWLLEESTGAVLLSTNVYKKVCVTPTIEKHSRTVQWQSIFDRFPDINGSKEQIKFKGNDLSRSGTPILTHFVRKFICAIGFSAGILI